MGDSNRGAPWAPMLLRSAVAAAFGILTVFWQAPGPAVLGVAGGLYLLLTGLALWRMAALAGRTGLAQARTLQLASAGVHALAGIAVLALQTVEVFCVAAGAAFLIGGAVDLFLWTKVRSAFLPARDWLITGVAGVGTAVLLVAVQAMALGAQAMLGITGGSAIIIAVVLAISGLGARWDARPGRGVRPAAASPENP